MSHGQIPVPMQAQPSPALKGSVTVPGDKSISHRSMILGLLTLGKTEITGLLEGEDVMRSADAARALGASVTHHAPGHWSVEGVGIGSLLAPRDTLDFGNAGTGSRLMIGVVGGHPIRARFDGDASLRKRPMGRILDPLKQMGLKVIEAAEGDRLPILIEGAKDCIPITYETPVASAQIKSAILFAGLNAPGKTTVIENEASRDHTESMLRFFGAEVISETHGTHGRKITLTGQPELAPKPIVVPADPSSAAFPIVAALIVPGSEIVVRSVMMNPLRIGLITTLIEMGGDIVELDRRVEGGETVADLRVRHSALKGVNVPADRAPSMIDEYPVLSVAAAFATGETRMNGLQELRVKESDRLAAVAAGLAANGIAHEIIGDDLIVSGTGQPARGGGMVETHMDHRIAMSFLILGLATQKPVGVDDMTFIATSFPDFVPLIRKLGGVLA